MFFCFSHTDGLINIFSGLKVEKGLLMRDVFTASLGLFMPILLKWFSGTSRCVALLGCWFYPLKCIGFSYVKLYTYIHIYIYIFLQPPQHAAPWYVWNCTSDLNLYCSPALPWTARAQRPHHVDRRTWAVSFFFYYFWRLRDSCFLCFLLFSRNISHACRPHTAFKACPHLNSSNSFKGRKRHEFTLSDINLA